MSTAAVAARCAAPARGPASPPAGGVPPRTGRPDALRPRWRSTPRSPRSPDARRAAPGDRRDRYGHGPAPAPSPAPRRDPHPTRPVDHHPRGSRLRRPGLRRPQAHHPQPRPRTAGRRRTPPAARPARPHPLHAQGDRVRLNPFTKGKHRQTPAELRADNERLTGELAEANKLLDESDELISDLIKDIDWFHDRWIEAGEHAKEAEIVVGGLEKQLAEEKRKVADLEAIA